MKIDMIAFDADDTLWENERLYQDAQTKLKEILSPWETPRNVDMLLYEMEMRNLPIYGYGIKAFSLSMMETALKVSDGKISGAEISAILVITRSMLAADIQLRPHAAETLESLSRKFPLMVITKGDLLDQTSKIKRSGLAKYFSITEIINDKTRGAYQTILEKYDLIPEKFLMVGNSLRSDILPVLELGGKAVYVPVDNTWAHEDVAAFDHDREGYFQLEHLGELPALIAKEL
jgi:putative hydrolase of the HAD superfamily